MIPNFSRLSLRHNSAPTGQFHVLTDEQVAKIGRDSITLEFFKAGQGRDDPDATFRVRNKNVNTTTRKYEYNWYVASQLWEWVKDNNKLPNTGDPIWLEDWWALHDQYAPGAAAPWRVRQLPRLDPSQSDTHAYADNDQADQQEKLDAMHQMLAQINRGHSEQYANAVADVILALIGFERNGFKDIMRVALTSVTELNRFRPILQSEERNEDVGKAFALKFYALFCAEGPIRDTLRAMNVESGIRAFVRYVASLELRGRRFTGPGQRSRQWKTDRLREARRVLHFLKWTEEIADDMLVPPPEPPPEAKPEEEHEDGVAQLARAVQEICSSLEAVASNGLIPPALNQQLLDIRVRYRETGPFTTDSAKKALAVQLFQSVINFVTTVDSPTKKYSEAFEADLEFFIVNLAGLLRLAVQMSLFPNPIFGTQLLPTQHHMKLFFWQRVAPLYEGLPITHGERRGVETAVFTTMMPLWEASRVPSHPRPVDAENETHGRHRQRTSACYLSM